MFQGVINVSSKYLHISTQWSYCAFSSAIPEDKLERMKVPIDQGGVGLGFTGKSSHYECNDFVMIFITCNESHDTST